MFMKNNIVLGFGLEQFWWIRFPNQPTTRRRRNGRGGGERVGDRGPMDYVCVSSRQVNSRIMPTWEKKKKRTRSQKRGNWRSPSPHTQNRGRHTMLFWGWFYPHPQHGRSFVRSSDTSGSEMRSPQHLLRTTRSQTQSKSNLSERYRI